ncbi:hypothetical protein VTL71DRAFT_1557 [Oculimacula yallundae]|uniref:Uncharacterized protein n=1 Tax=Oculimacula yallundae TaxID=86028 RepID=A0ABR4CDF6_9HELO
MLNFLLSNVITNYLLLEERMTFLSTQIPSSPYSISLKGSEATQPTLPPQINVRKGTGTQSRPGEYQRMR